MKKKIIKLSLLFIFSLLITTALINGEEGYLPVFPGMGHSWGCHDDPNDPNLSENGKITLKLSEGDVIEPNTEFEIEATISDFTEAADRSGQYGIDLGFSDQRSDNSEFEFDPKYYTELTSDSFGNVASQTFKVTAPEEKGTYTITVDALSVGDGFEPINWTYASVEITVGTSGDQTETDQVYIMYGVFAGLGVLCIVISLSIKFLKSSREENLLNKNIDRRKL